MTEKAINQVDKSGVTALHCAVTKGDNDLVDSLIKKGVNLDKADAIGETPLIKAIGFDKKDVFGIKARCKQQKVEEVN
jgi:ankyrin repeat protein